ncbi:MAG: UDP-N-acetylglucosamine 2-epimerase (non-hydrolyzing) [Candidatus Scalindua sp.]|nr:UDP-N-acetylglucosamine 2-epimerase (non-hydrolyzing) [Candidatus Scalindua sp.]
MKKIMFVFGTRPEVIKMAPVVSELKKYSNKIRTIVTVSAQHREMMDQMLEIFDIQADYDLNVMTDNQKLSDVTCDIIKGLDPILGKEKIDFILVQGDTTTAFAASLVGFYHKVKVGHVEAGLRTHDKFYPFPEEMNRTLVTSLSDVHFAPTSLAKDNLLREGVPKQNIIVTGNTVIDALLLTVNKKGFAGYIRQDTHKMILVTTHRRENFGEPLEEICKAILDIVAKHKNVKIVFPVHLNPNVRKIVHKYLSNEKQIELTEPLDYAAFTKYIADSYFILTDSGGIQEEAPSLGKPVLVLRNETERREGVEAGTCLLVGTNRQRIVKEANKLLMDKNAYEKMSQAVNPYGDGKASKRIVKFFLNGLGKD